MQFLNAEKGTKLILVSQIFAIISSILGAFSALVISNIIRSALSSDVRSFSLFDIAITFGSSFLMISSLIGTIIIAFIGYVKCSKDEPEFKKAMICSIVSGLLVLTGNLFQVPSATLYTVLVSAGTIFEMFGIIYALSAFNKISESCGRPDMIKRGTSLVNFVFITYFISSVDTLIIRIFELSSQAVFVSDIVETLNMFLSIAQHIFFLIFLIKTLKMLRESNSEGKGEAKRE